MINKYWFIKILWYNPMEKKFFLTLILKVYFDFETNSHTPPPPFFWFISSIIFFINKFGFINKINLLRNIYMKNKWKIYYKIKTLPKNSSMSTHYTSVIYIVGWLMVKCPMIS